MKLASRSEQRREIASADGIALARHRSRLKLHRIDVQAEFIMKKIIMLISQKRRTLELSLDPYGIGSSISR